MAIFYYPWYGTAAVDGAWQHWQQNGNDPPASIASNWFPARGRLLLVRRGGRARADARDRVDRRSDRDRLVVGAGIGGGRSAARSSSVPHARPGCGWRCTSSRSPDERPRRSSRSCAPVVKSGITDAYVYDSTTSATPNGRPPTSNSRACGSLPTRTCPGKAEAGGFAGLYTYDVRIYDGTSFPRMCASARMHNLLCAPSVGPGFDAERATGDTRIQGRANGKTYDRMWRGAIRAAADVVTITSYNEWHEGTQIEPASAVGAPVLVLRRCVRPHGSRRRACVPRPHGGLGAHLPREGRPLKPRATG